MFIWENVWPILHHQHCGQNQDIIGFIFEKLIQINELFCAIKVKSNETKRLLLIFVLPIICYSGKNSWHSLKTDVLILMLISDFGINFLNS
jgi:hypothetical protein